MIASTTVPFKAAQGVRRARARRRRRCCDKLCLHRRLVHGAARCPCSCSNCRVWPSVANYSPVQNLGLRTVRLARLATRSLGLARYLLRLTRWPGLRLAFWPSTRWAWAAGSGQWAWEIMWVGFAGQGGGGPRHTPPALPLPPILPFIFLLPKIFLLDLLPKPHQLQINTLVRWNSPSPDPFSPPSALGFLLCLPCRKNRFSSANFFSPLLPSAVTPRSPACFPQRLRSSPSADPFRSFIRKERKPPTGSLVLVTEPRPARRVSTAFSRAFPSFRESL